MDKLFIGITELKKLEDVVGVVKPTEPPFSRYCHNEEYKGLKNKKIDAVNHVYDKYLEKQVTAEGFYYFSDMSFQDGSDVEIFAKVLFKFLYEKREVGTYPEADKGLNPLFIAVDFQSEDYNKERSKDFAKEFIRIFSVFYIKSDNNGSSSYMKGVQIAVCSNNEVNFVLAGEKLASAYETAKNFVYYNADATLEFVPLLDFLSVTKKEGGEKEEEKKVEPLFPFDLYLQTLTKDNKQISWFEKQMQDRLDTDLRMKKYGCKISNVKVRLGSKIYINTFYEAELLLHNVGTIKRFAFLLAQDIIKEIEADSTFAENLKDCKEYLFLLGYENYSAVLMQEVHELLKDFFGVSSKIEWLIDTRSEDFPVLSFDKFSRAKKEEICKAEKVRCITILPLGSTMSTVYKLHDSFKRGLERVGKEIESEGKENSTNSINSEESFMSNYCLVAIGSAFCDETIKGVEERYLQKFIQKSNTSIWHTVELTPNKNRGEETAVKYLLSASAQWSNPYPDTKKTEEQDIEKTKGYKKPLLKVDKTSTLLDAYFQTPLQQNVLEYYKSDSHVDKLAPIGDVSFLKYGHILRGDNHYQFYFDFEKITEIRKNEIIKWAIGKKTEIDNEAYNIVISPLQITNASFLKIILDETFGSNLHLLHINIQATGKENVRTKFEYIAQEFVNITRQEQKINFYYVDDAVCTGNGLARAWKFILTLCNQSGVDSKKLFLQDEKFTKVFLLLNRSSYETAQTWVKNPNEDWLGFINLCVPSYNTHMENNVVTCPGCRVHARYGLLRERCATNDLVGYFSKQAKKHLPRNPKEYDLWLNEQILNSPSYFEWLRTWVWYHKRGNDALYKVIKSFYDMGNEETRDEWWKKQTIKELLDLFDKNEEFRKGVIAAFEYSVPKEDFRDKDFINLVIQKVHMIIAEDNFLRIETMDDAYRKLLYDDRLQEIYSDCRNTPESAQDKFENYKDALRKKIIEMLAGCFTGVEESRRQLDDYKSSKKTDNTNFVVMESKLNEEIYNATFRFISYIKVISRDYLAKNYFIREAMYNVLCDLFKIMTMSRGELSSNQFATDLIEISLKIRNLKEENVIEAALQYRIFKVVTHRLALMKSEKMFQKDTIEKTNSAYEAMDKDEQKDVDEHTIKDNEKKIFLALPSKYDMTTSYLASIKTATMEDDNDAVCFTLWCETNKL